MLPVDVLVGGVAAPTTATQGERLAHAVPEVSTVGRCLWLVNHDTRGLGATCQGDDVVIAV